MVQYCPWSHPFRNIHKMISASADIRC
uniref:Uncharacterized protein n=1 Tax=Anguilla anguilla TaxID=7936 RepID=A0A0E9RYI8_ANGAN